ncbi:MAG: hypothetical protein ACI9JZ_002202 [Lentimonas sp.]|jgi:hypothetical protein
MHKYLNKDPEHPFIFTYSLGIYIVKITIKA